MKELIYPRLLLSRAERLADKIGFVDVTREGSATGDLRCPRRAGHAR